MSDRESHSIARYIRQWFVEDDFNSHTCSEFHSKYLVLERAIDIFL